MDVKKIRIVSRLLVIDFVLLAVSGFLLHGADTGRTIWAVTHGVTGIACILLVSLHVIQHKRLIRKYRKLTDVQG